MKFLEDIAKLKPDDIAFVTYPEAKGQFWFNQGDLWANGDDTPVFLLTPRDLLERDDWYVTTR